MPFRFYLLSGISVWQSFCLFTNACRAWRASIFLPLSFLFFRRCKIRNYPRHWKNFLRCFSLKMPFYWYTSIMCAHTMHFSAFWLHRHHIQLRFILSNLLVACDLFARCCAKGKHCGKSRTRVMPCPTMPTRAVFTRSAWTSAANDAASKNGKLWKAERLLHCQWSWRDEIWLSLYFLREF